MTPAPIARYGLALLAADGRSIARDPILAAGAVFSLLPGLVLLFWGSALEAAAQEALGWTGAARVATALAIVLPGAMFGWITGFLLLEDRDDHVLVAIEITPLGKTGFFAYRLASCFAAACLAAFATALLAAPQTTLPLALGLAVLSGGHAMSVALILVIFAANKVEGLALTKLINLTLLAPLIALVPGPLRFLGGIVPPFWLGEMLELGPDPLAWPFALLAGLAASLAVIALLHGQSRKRLG